MIVLTMNYFFLQRSNRTRLHLSHNHLTGSIPHTFKSGDVDIRPIGK